MRIESARLVLKQHTLENAVRLNEWENDPQLIYYNDDQPIPFPSQPLEETYKYLRRHLEFSPNSQAIHYAIHRKEDGVFIGYGMIAYIDRYNRRCRLGITIGDKSQWGLGYAKEALTAIIDYCFTDLDLNRIGAEIYAYNTRSLALFEKLGFKCEGVIRQCVYKRGRFEDERLYGLLREEWERA